MNDGTTDNASSSKKEATEDATMDDYSSSTSSSTLTSSSDDDYDDDDDELTNDEQNDGSKKVATTINDTTTTTVVDTNRLEILSESLSSILQSKSTKPTKLLLSEYRSALLHERRERLLLQDLVYRQMKQIQKLQTQLQLNNEALSDLAVRNMSLEEDLEKLRIANENSENLAKQQEKKRSATSLKISNLFGKNSRKEKSNDTVLSSSMHSNGDAYLSSSYSSAIVEADTPPLSSPKSYHNDIESSTLADMSPREAVESPTKRDNKRRSTMFAFKDKLKKNATIASSAEDQSNNKLLQQLEKQVLDLQKNEASLQDKAKNYESTISHLQSQTRVTRDMLQESQGQLGKALEQCKLLTLEHTKLSNQVQELKSTISEQDAQIQLLRNNVKMGEEKLASCEVQVAQKFEEKLNELREQLQEKDNTIVQMSEKLMTLKDQLNNIRLQLRKYPVKHLHKLRPKTDAVIVLHKNPMNNMFMIDVLEAKSGKVIHSYPLTFLVDVQKDASHLNRFSLVFGNKSVEWFESTSCSEVVTSVKELMTIVSSSQ